MRVSTIGAIVLGGTINIAAQCQEQKVVYLDGVSSSALRGDTDPVVSQEGNKARETLPTLLRAGWRIESVHPTSDGKAHVVLIAPAKVRR